MTIQEQWFYGGPRRTAFRNTAAMLAANPGTSTMIWRECDGLVCPIGGYYYTGAGHVTKGDPDVTPEMAILNRSILAGAVVTNDGVNWIVAATGQPVGLMGGVIVLPGQPQAPTPAPAQGPTTGPTGLAGIIAKPSAVPSGITALTQNQANSLLSIPAMQSDIDKIKATLTAMGFPV